MNGAGHPPSLRLFEGILARPHPAGPFPVVPSLSHSTPSPPSCVLCAWASLFPFPVDVRASYLVPFRSFGARPSPGSRMPLQTKVR